MPPRGDYAGLTRSPWEQVVMAGIFLVILLGAWHWHARVSHDPRRPVSSESWEHVRERFPMPAPVEPSSTLSPDALNTVVRANPFSPQRRYVPPQASGAASGAETASITPSPQFVYKGHIVMGARQRAVLEDLTAKKTYFLQIGQEVAGYKVLDISETQVVLSAPEAQEPLTLRLTPKP